VVAAALLRVHGRQAAPKNADASLVAWGRKFTKGAASMIEALLALGVGTIGGVAGVVVAVILVALLGRHGGPAK
jgi:hypothetical protein